MASPDGVGWPEDPAGFLLRDTRDESRLAAAGLGWPGGAPRTGQAGTGSGRGPAGGGAGGRDRTGGSPASGGRPGGASGEAGGGGTSKTGDGGQGQVLRGGEAEAPPARVKQALSAAVSRETDTRNVGARDEAQGSGAVRTRGRPTSAAGAFLEQEAPGGQGTGPVGSRPMVPAQANPTAVPTAHSGAGPSQDAGPRERVSRRRHGPPPTRARPPR